MIVTIDGYAGTGKSLAAVNLARALGLPLLNTGAMYRAAALALADSGIDINAEPRDISEIERIVGTFDFDMNDGETFLNGVRMTARIAGHEAGVAASRVGTFREVRERLKAEQRRLASGRSMICEGRDQGTSVFPDAEAKFFFIADLEVRVARRCQQLRQLGHAIDADHVRKQIILRDEQDVNREIDPLKQAHDAIVIDTSTLSPDEVLARMISVVEKCRSPV